MPAKSSELQTEPSTVMPEFTTINERSAQPRDAFRIVTAEESSASSTIFYCGAFVQVKDPLAVCLPVVGLYVRQH